MAGVSLVPDVDQAGAQRLAGDDGVEMALVANRVEIESAAIDRQVTPPVVGDPAVHEVPAPGDLRQAIRAALQGRFPRRPGDIAVVPVVRRNHGNEAQDIDLLGHIGVAVNGNRQRVRRLDAGDPFENPSPSRSHEVVAERVQREFDIRGGDRRAIVPAGLGSQSKYDASPIGAQGHRFGQAAVEAGEFVSCTLQQTVVRLEKSRRFGRRCRAHLAVGIGQRQCTPLRGIGVDVVEVREILGVFQVVVGYLRNSVTELEGFVIDDGRGGLLRIQGQQPQAGKYYESTVAGTRALFDLRDGTCSGTSALRRVPDR